MGVLKLVQTSMDGRSKTWKLNSTSNIITIGNSRKANIGSIDKSLAQFEAAIEYRNSNWYYISFSLGHMPSETLIQNGGTIHLTNSTLNFEIINKNLSLFNNINETQLNGKTEQILILVTKNNRILNLAVKDPSSTYNILVNGKYAKLTLEPKEVWSFKEFNDHTLKYKKISGEDLSVFKKSSQNQMIDKEDKFTVGVTLAVTCLLIAASFIVSGNKSTMSTLPTQAANIIIKNDIKKKISKKTKPTPSGVQKEIAQDTRSESPQGGTKISALLKNSIGVRLSKLIGKVSATEARSANILVTTTGAKAGHANTGRALASLGSVEASGRNWDGESNRSGNGVSTAGIGGGKNSNQLGGGLGQGKTGSGGVGLLEDESEIVGGLDREVIAEYIKTQLGQILFCYERQLSANPNLYGKIAVKFTISGTGLVEAQSINDTTLKNSSVESCILNKVSKWKFPQPRGGTKVLVTYPFLFKSVI